MRPISGFTRNPNQKGVALLIVLWMNVLLTVVGGSFAYNAQVEGLLARRAIDELRGGQAARAGLELAVYQLKQSCIECRPWADGRPYKIAFDGRNQIESIALPLTNEVKSEFQNSKLVTNTNDKNSNDQRLQYQPRFSMPGSLFAWNI